MSDPDFIATLPIERRLALAYAPGRSRVQWLGLLALDARLGGVVRAAHEPLLAQIKLAWWRDELAKPLAERRRGEPLLELLNAWGDNAGSLGALVDGWEVLLAGEDLTRADVVAFADARARACCGLAATVGVAADNAAIAAQRWALADLAAAIADPAQRAVVEGVIGEQQWPRIRLPRELRPLQVFYGLARRHGGPVPLIGGVLTGMRAVRLGLLGI